MDRAEAVIRVPIELPETTVRFLVGTSKAPAISRPTRRWYPFAQEVEDVTFDADLGEITIKLNAAVFGPENS